VPYVHNKGSTQLCLFNRPPYLSYDLKLINVTLHLQILAQAFCSTTALDCIHIDMGTNTGIHCVGYSKHKFARIPMAAVYINTSSVQIGHYNIHYYDYDYD